MSAPGGLRCEKCGAALAAGAVACFRCGRMLEEQSGAPHTEAGKLPTQLGTQVRGELVDGQFRLQRPIGQGPVGVVWQAVEVSLDRPVALKLMHEAVAEDAQQVERFEKEARQLASIEHPNLLTVIAVGRVGRRPYLVTRLVNGVTLAEHRHALGGKLDAPRAARVLAPVCDALSALHERGVIHRGVKLSNIIVGDPDVTLLEPGRAFETGAALSHVGLRPEESLCLSPEQLAGEAIDTRADLYAVGCLLYELLTGAPPFSGSLAEQLSGHRSAPRPLAQTEVPALAALAQQAMAINPAERPASAQAVRAALVPFLPVSTERPQAQSLPLASLLSAARSSPEALPLRDPPTRVDRAPIQDAAGTAATARELSPVIFDPPPGPQETNRDLPPVVAQESFSLELGSPVPRAAPAPVPISMLANVEPAPAAASPLGAAPFDPDTRLMRKAGEPSPATEPTQPSGRSLAPAEPTNVGRALAPAWVPWMLVGLSVVLVVVATVLLLRPETLPPDGDQRSAERIIDLRRVAQPESAPKQGDAVPVPPIAPTLASTPATARVVPSIEERRAPFYMGDPVAVPPRRARKPSKVPVKRGNLRITTTWDGDVVPAFVWFDGKARGQSPVEILAVKQGEHVIRIDYQDKAPFEIRYPVIAAPKARKGDDVIIELKPEVHRTIGVVKGERR